MAGRAAASREDRRVTKRGLTAALGKASKRLERSRTLREGAIAFHVSGSVTGHFRLLSKGGRVEPSELDDPAGAPAALIEVIGDAAAISAVLDGSADAQEEYLAGSFRVQGDLPYLSDLAVEAGFIEHPL